MNRAAAKPASRSVIEAGAGRNVAAKKSAPPPAPTKSSGPSLWSYVLAGGFAFAGLTKLFENPLQRRLFRSLDWSEENMRLVGMAEVLGGALVLTRPTRRLGGAMLSTTSAAVLAAELTHGDAKLGLPRLAMLVAAITAL